MQEQRQKQPSYPKHLSIDAILDDAQAARQTLRLSPAIAEFARQKYGVGIGGFRRQPQPPPPPPPPPAQQPPSPPSESSPPLPTPPTPPPSQSSRSSDPTTDCTSPLTLLRQEAEIAALSAMVQHMRAGVQAGDRVRQSLEQRFQQIGEALAAANKQQGSSPRACSFLDEPELSHPELAAIEAAEAAERRAAEQGRANLAEVQRLFKSLPASPPQPHADDLGNVEWRQQAERFAQAKYRLYSLTVQASVTDGELAEAKRYHDDACEAARLACEAADRAAEAAQAAAEAAQAAAKAAEAAAKAAEAAAEAASASGSATFNDDTQTTLSRVSEDPSLVDTSVAAASSAPAFIGSGSAPVGSAPAPVGSAPAPVGSAPAPDVSDLAGAGAAPSGCAGADNPLNGDAPNVADSSRKWQQCCKSVADLRTSLADLISGATPKLMTFKLDIEITLQNLLAQFCASDKPVEMIRKRHETMTQLLKIFCMEPFVSFYQQRQISSIREVPLGEKFSLFNFCECAVLQAENQFGQLAKLQPDEEGADHLYSLRIAVSLAMAAAMLCSCRKQLEPMLLQYLIAECPLLLPHPPPPDWLADRSTEDRVMRCRALGRLYAALFCAPPQMGSFSRPSSFSLNHDWSLAARLIRLSARGRHTHLLTCATLHSVLEIAGNSMWKRYGVQFTKLLQSALELYSGEAFFTDSSAVQLVQYLQFVLAAGSIPNVDASGSVQQLLSAA